jgi:hypothetical protein
MSEIGVNKVTRAIQIASMFTILCVANAAVADTVFRYLDENGLVVYSDRPAAYGEQETIEIAIQHSNTRAPEPEKKKTPDEYIAEAASLRESQTAERAAEEQVINAQVAEQRSTNCTAAKNRQEKYSTNHRLYKPKSNGEREYLSSDELDAARAEAARTVDEWCS